MGSSQKGGGARTPYEAPNTLNSAQNLRIIDAISEGEIAGFAHGNNAPFKSIYFDDTPVQNPDNSFNFNGITGYFQVGTPDQSYIPNFDVSERTVSVSANIKKNTPIIRAISDNTVNRLRVTVGVERNAQVKDNGDTVPANTELVIELVNNSGVQASRHVLFNEKSSGAFYYDVVFDSLPAVPFNIRVRRLTADSTSDKVANNTFFASYVEMIDAKLSYPHTALSALKIDSDQFGNSVPRRNYLLRGKLLQVPSNYDPETRTYAGGLWDGSFKTAWSNNPAWIFYDLLTNERYSTLARRLTAGDIDKWALYQIAKYCDELVPDGFGGQEPRFVCNAYITDQRQAGELLNDLASVFCGLAVWNGNQISVMQDKHTDPVAVYSNANVVDGEFSYAGASLKAIHTAVHVRYADKHDGYRSKVEYIADDEAVARYGLNIKSVTAFGCDSRGQAVRFGTWILQTELRQQHTVSFSVGREGLKHLPYDVIRIADNDYAGAQLGGRVVAVSGDTITLDRDVAQAVGALLYYVDGKVLKNIKIIAQPKNNQVRVETVISIKVGDTWGLSGKVKSRLYRAVSIKENADDGTYTITALLHDPAKYGVVDESAIFDDAVATLHSATPELKNAAISTQDGSIILTWDNLTADGSVLDYDIKIYRNNQLYRHIPDAKTAEIALTNLPNGDYRAVIRGRNARGVYSTPLIKGWSINYTITGLRTTPKTMAIALDWVLPAIVVSDVVSEVWYGRSQDSSQAQLLAKLPYPQNSYLLTGVAVTDTFYFWVRLVDRRGNSGQFTTAVIGQADPDPAPIVAQITGAITESVLAQTLLDKLAADDATVKAAAIAETTKQVQAEATARVTAIRAEATARANAITAAANTQAANLRTEVGKLNTAIQAASTTAQANLTAKAAELTAKDNELKAQADNLLSQANDLATQARQLGVKITAVERVNAEQVQQISTVTAAQGTTAAALEEERTARASGDAAEAAARQTLAAEVSNNKAAIAAETKARADADKAEVAARTTLATRVGAAETAISAERTARTNADTAQTQAREALAAELTNTKAALEAERTARADGDRAEAQARDTLATRVSAAESAIGIERTARTTAIAAETRAREALAARVATAESGLSAERTARANADTAQTQEINAAKARLGTAETNIGTLQSTVAETNRALTTAQQTLTAKIDGIEIGGRNHFKKTTALASLRTGGTIQHNALNGINITTSNSNHLIFRLNRVIDTVGMWTVSMDIKCAAGTHNVFVDVNDEGRQQFTVTTDFRRISLTVATTRFTDVYHFVDIETNSTAAFEIKNVKIEKGNRATDWTPAPEDIDAATVAVAAELTAFKQAQATTDAAQTRELNTAKSQIAGHTSEISTLKTTKADSSQVVTLARTGLQSEWRSYTDTAKRDAATDATTKANAARAAAEQTAQTKATEAQQAAERAAQTKADAAKAAAIAAASGDATDKANAAKAAAIADAAAKDAVVKRDAATDAQRKADAAKTAAIAEAQRLNTATDAKIATLQQTVSNDRQAAATRHDSLSAKLDNLGAVNVLVDSDFVHSAVWGKVSRYSKSQYHGRTVVRVDITQAVAGQAGVTHAAASRVTRIEQGQTYTVSLNVQGTAEIAAAGLNYLYLMRADGANQHLPTATVTSSLSNRVSVTFTAQWSSQQAYLLVAVNGTFAVGQWFAYHSVKLERGSVATDWSPTPVDIDNAVAGVQAALDSHKAAQATADAAQTAEINTAKSQINTHKSAIDGIKSTKADKTEVASLARTTLQSEWKSYTDTAKSAAATDAQQKADAAKAAAIAAADTAAKAKADAAKTAAIAAASDDATTKANAAKTAAIADAAAKDAVLKQQAATDAQAKADAAKNAAIAEANRLNTATQATVTTLQQTVSNNQSATATELAGIKATAGRHTTEINSIKTAKADKTEVSNLAKTGLQSVWQADAQAKANDAVNALHIGGRNYLLQSDQVLSKNNQVDASNNTTINLAMSNAIDYAAANELTLSVYVKAVNVTTTTAPTGSSYRRIGVEVYLNYTDGTKQWFGTWQTAFGAAVDKRIARTLKIPDGKVLQGITYAKIQIHTIKGDTLVVSRPKLEIGNKATDWTPAPEDLDAAISTVSASLESFKTTQASKDTAQTSEINTAKSQIAGQAARINQLEQTRVTAEQAESIAQTTVSASFTMPDTRHDNQPPTWYWANYPRKKASEFKTEKAVGLSNLTSFVTVETVVPWSNPSGGAITQTAYLANGTVMRRKSDVAYTYAAATGYTYTKDQWASWVADETVTGSQTKATAAKDAAIAEARKLDTATNAKVTALQKTVADNQSAMATRVSSVEAKANGNTARITSTTEAVTALSGKVQALYSVRVESISHNRKVIAGLALGADGQTGDSQMLVYADKFGLVNPQSKAFDVPFAVNQTAGGAKMALKGDFIANGTIHGKHIAASQAIQSPIINGGTINAGTLNSTIINNGNGNFTVDAAGNMVAKSGRFEGTVYASRIEGDILKMHPFVRVSTGYYRLNIAAQMQNVIAVVMGANFAIESYVRRHVSPQARAVELKLNSERVVFRKYQSLVIEGVPVQSTASILHLGGEFSLNESVKVVAGREINLELFLHNGNHSGWFDFSSTPVVYIGRA